MNDMTAVIVPKSDQINADDLIAGPMTIKVAEVRISPGTEQPVSIVFEGSTKFFRPCKSMSRVLVKVWGPDAKAYVGRSMTLYRDPKVKWGGMEVGGIRISHMTNLDDPIVMALTESKANRKPFTVKPLVASASTGAGFTIDDARDAIEGAGSLEILRNIWAHKDMAPFRDQLQPTLDARKGALSGEGPSDTDRGETQTGAAEDLIARIEAADSAGLQAIVDDWFADGKSMIDEADHARVETAMDDRKVALKGGE